MENKKYFKFKKLLFHFKNNPRSLIVKYPNEEKLTMRKKEKKHERGIGRK